MSLESLVVNRITTISSALNNKRLCVRKYSALLARCDSPYPYGTIRHAIDMACSLPCLTARRSPPCRVRCSPCHPPLLHLSTGKYLMEATLFHLAPSPSGPRRNTFATLIQRGLTSRPSAYLAHSKSEAVAKSAASGSSSGTSSLVADAGTADGGKPQRSIVMKHQRSYGRKGSTVRGRTAVSYSRSASTVGAAAAASATEAPAAWQQQAQVQVYPAPALPVSSNAAVVRAYGHAPILAPRQALAACLVVCYADLYRLGRCVGASRLLHQ